MTPGVQGAVLRGKTALVLTHCNGLFAWCVFHNFLFLLFVGSCRFFPTSATKNSKATHFVFHLLLFRENKSDAGNIVHNFSLIGSHSNSVQRGECLAMHGALVAMGTRSGAVYVYHLDGNWENQVSVTIVLKYPDSFIVIVFNKFTCKAKLDLTLKAE